MARRRRAVGGPRQGVPASPPDRASDSTRLTVSIDSVGANGMGRAIATVGDVERTITIPYVLAGEIVEVRVDRARGERLEGDLVRVLSPAPGRRSPPCRHFGTCGGCALQHWPEDAYAASKVAAIIQALRARDLAPPDMAPMVRTGPAGRRRADVTLRRVAGGAVAGFTRRATHAIIDLEECPVLMPQVAALLPRLRALASDILPPGATAEAVINWIDTGADILLVPGDRLPLDLARRTALAAFAEGVDAARVSWGPRRSAEPVVTRRAPRLRFGRIDVEPPPGAFLQASLSSEAALQAVVHDWLGPARRIVDFYGGIGTLSLGSVPQRRVTLVEGDRAAVAAVEAAVRKAALGGVVHAIVRDLAHDPMPADDLSAFDAAILDPPRAGAPTQATELARSVVPAVIAVSCDAQTFARDARILVDGGYRLERLVPVDQFLWSPHVELAALFRR